jgi:FkbM family methyltransferase
MGFDLRRWPEPNPAVTYFAAAVRTGNVNVVFDIGANTGQFATGLRAAGYEGTILSFEPCAEARVALNRASHMDAGWLVHADALGDRDGSAALTIFNRTDMCSILPISEKGRALFPHLAPIGTEAVQMRRLESLGGMLLADRDIPALKIDVQGMEGAVLAGAGALLDRCAAVQAEVSLEPLYQGAAVFEDIHDLLRAYGYRLALMTPVTFPKTGGPPIEVDALFLR